MSETMRVIAITNERTAEVKNVKKPPVRVGKVMVKIHACALCTFEQRMFTGEKKIPLPFVGGHEFVGEVYQLGEGVSEKQFPIGSKISVRLIRVCGKCYFCRRGEENLCTEMESQSDPDMEIIGMGGMSEFINVEPSQVYHMNIDTPDEIACFSEPLACVLTSIERGNIQLGDDVLVLGGGIMGMLHVMCAKLSGARVILSEPDEVRRKLAMELGADITVNPMETDIASFMKKLNGVGAQAVFNTTPISAVAKQALDSVAPLGRVIMYSSQHPDRPIEVSPNWLHNSQSIITGAASPSVRAFDRSVNMLNKGLIDPTRLVSAIYPAQECQQAFETAVRPDTFRVIVSFVK